jgi:hypothetical protein
VHIGTKNLERFFTMVFALVPMFARLWRHV